MYKMSIIQQAKTVLEIEVEALNNLKNSIDKSFEDVVGLITTSKGKVFLSGIGKSGLVARKIAATLSSTGTPAFFIHATDCLHGDAGIISKDDVGLLLSNSGETEELLQIIPILKRIGVVLVAITGKKNSTLAKQSDHVLSVPVEREACPMGIVPTASTMVMMALGDALAVSLLVSKGFNTDDFAKLHPGGVIGRKLLIRVKDIMHVPPKLPLIKEDADMRDTLIEMTSKSLGITGVTDKDGFLIGCVTDGDLRRHMERSRTFLDDKVGNVMGKSPKVIDGEELAVNGLNMMETNKITHLFVVDINEYKKTGRKKVVGLLHIHNILGAKII
ncbi:MAG: KpsF/GutQ family sugar-phosphate isomerase [Pseudomonadota bacterium]